MGVIDKLHPLGCGSAHDKEAPLIQDGVERPSGGNGAIGAATGNADVAC